MKVNVKPKVTNNKPPKRIVNVLLTMSGDVLMDDFENFFEEEECNEKGEYPEQSSILTLDALVSKIELYGDVKEMAINMDLLYSMDVVNMDVSFKPNV